MADLPTNYLDDILAQSMNGKRKFRITRPDGTFEEVIIEDISEYSQTGSTFGAGDINRTNQAVNEKFDSEDVVDPMLTTEPGFAADAYKTKLQFDEQNKNFEWKLAGSVSDGNPLDISKISFKELLIQVHFVASPGVIGDGYVFNIIKSMLKGSALLFNQGYGYSTSNYGLCQIEINSTSAKVSNFVHAGEGPRSNIMHVYYR